MVRRLQILRLLDFIFAWIVLTLAGHLLSIFGLAANLALLFLAAILLLPIARQILRVRTVLSPPRTPDELSSSVRQARTTIYAVYVLLVSSLIFIGIILFSNGPEERADRYFAWALFACAVLMILALPFAKGLIERALIRMQKSDLV
jgi:hypothetical protein